MKNKNESGIALIAALMIMILMGAMLHVLIVKVYSSQMMIRMDKPGCIRIKKPGVGDPNPKYHMYSKCTQNAD